MRLAIALVADAAVVHPDGKLSVIGAGISGLRAPQFPFTYPMLLALALNFEFTPSECGRQKVLEVRLLDPDGRELTPTLSQQVVPQRNPIDPTLPSGHLAVFNYLQLKFTKPGDNAFSVLLDGQEVVSLPLRIMKINQAIAA
jgi:hypothetical protein